MVRYSMWLVVGVVLFAGILPGCQKFTHLRYETIYAGMSEFEVEKTLGEPYARFSDTWSYVHDDPFYKAVIEFKDGRVVDKVWYDEKEMGNHPDSKFDESEGPSVIIKSDTVVE